MKPRIKKISKGWMLTGTDGRAVKARTISAISYWLENNNTGSDRYPWATEAGSQPARYENDGETTQVS